MAIQHSSKKRVTIKEIAAMAGTSKTTVSFYLNGKTDRMSDETQARIRKAIHDTGYEPSPLARGMNAKSTQMIGVIIGDITNTFANQLVKGIDTVTSAEGYRMLVCASNFDKQGELAYIDRLIALGVDGFIVQPTARFKEISKSISESGKPLVFIDPKLYDFNSNWVKTDNYEASYLSRPVSKKVISDFWSLPPRRASSPVALSASAVLSMHSKSTIWDSPSS